MTDAVKMALEALMDIRTSIECAAGCDEGIEPMAAVSEIMSAYGTAMASAYSRAADMVNILAALEQAGEPVAAVLLCDVKLPPATTIRAGCNMETLLLAMNVPDRPKHFEDDKAKGPVAMIRAADGTVQPLVIPQEAPLPTIQRLGQEFDAGEGEPAAWFYEIPGSGVWRLYKMRYVSPQAVAEGWTETPLYAHPPQSPVAAEPVGQDRNEAIMALTAKFGPILKASFPNEHSRTRFDVANALVEVAVATPSQPDPQSRELSDNQIDTAKAGAMDQAADFCIRTLAKALGVDDWEQADGSETWDGDVAGTIYNVLKSGRVYDDEDGRVARLEDATQSRGQAFDGDGEACKVLRAISARMTIACDWTKAGKDHIKVRTADWHVLMEIGHQARALSSAKRVEEG